MLIKGALEVYSISGMENKTFSKCTSTHALCLTLFPHFATYLLEQSIYFIFFLAGSVLAVTTADPYASEKTNRFVGICIQRGGKGLGATFVLRNVIEDQGGFLTVAIMLEMVSKKH